MTKDSLVSLAQRLYEIFSTHAGQCHSRVNNGRWLGWENEKSVWNSSGTERRECADRSQTNNRTHFPACPRGSPSRVREACGSKPQQDRACWVITCTRTWRRCVATATEANAGDGSRSGRIFAAFQRKHPSRVTWTLMSYMSVGDPLRHKSLLVNNSTLAPAVIVTGLGQWPILLKPVLLGQNHSISSSGVPISPLSLAT